MNRDDVLNALRAHKAVLSERFGVAELALFGSFARDQASDESDLDILVSFQGKADWQRCPNSLPLCCFSAAPSNAAICSSSRNPKHIGSRVTPCG